MNIMNDYDQAYLSQLKIAKEATGQAVRDAVAATQADAAAAMREQQTALEIRQQKVFIFSELNFIPLCSNT